LAKQGESTKCQDSRHSAQGSPQQCGHRHQHSWVRTGTQTEKNEECTRNKKSNPHVSDLCPCPDKSDELLKSSVWKDPPSYQPAEGAGLLLSRFGCAFATKMATSIALSLDNLPSDPLLLVLSFLDLRDLSSCSIVSRRFNELTGHNPLWKRLCQKHWLLTEEDKIRSGTSWKDLFRQYYADLGRYIDSYKGVREEELDTIEAQIGCKLPNDYRCSYRIHNGQKLVVPGLMGSMALSNHYRSEDLLDIETAAGGFQQRKGMKQCLPLTFCFHTGLSQYMALESIEGRIRSEMFYQCPDQLAQDPAAIDMFITGSSFTDWFTSYVDNVVTGEYPIIRDQIFRIEMSKSALPEQACQLDSRYWKITNANGNVEEVRGPGVVGEFPVMTPGKVHEYASCTTFSTTSEYMEGHYTFHRLKNKEEVFDVSIPRFHMVCPPFRESTVRSNSSDTDDYEEGEMRGMNMADPGGRCPRHI
ncbi:hypothetical protein DNTS_002493, partial [Danionella cerebrum]